jgi:cell division protein FtsL
MSTPARKLTAPRPVDRRTPGGRGGAGAPGRAHRAHGVDNGIEGPLRRHNRAVPPKRRRKQHRLGFAVFASALVASMVLGIVVLHALLAQQSFRLADAERKIDQLSVERLELLRAQATLSAPGRIADWAFRHGMRLPDDIRILRAPEGSGDPSGAVTTFGDATDEASTTDAARASAHSENG